MENESMKVGGAIHRLSHLLDRYISAQVKEAGMDDVPVMHNWVIRYLYQQRDTDVYQRDIERQFSIGRSAVTSILQLLEKNGYISRTAVASDARLKKVELTAKGAACHDQMDELGVVIGSDMLRGISEADLTQFLQTIEQIERNLKTVTPTDGADCEKGKEECHAKDIAQSSKRI